MGDFKINLLRFHNCKYAQKCILISLHSFNLTPIIDKPTRVYHNSYSLIYNLFASNLEDTMHNKRKYNLRSNWSLFSILNSTPLISKVKKILLRDFSNYSEAKFLNELSQLDPIGAVSGLNDVNKSLSVFYNKLNKLLNKHAPFKPISKRKKKRLLKPWVTKGIRKSITIKMIFLVQASPPSTNCIGTKCWRSQELAQRCLYFHKYFEENFTNIKKKMGGHQQSFRPEKQCSQRYNLS